MDNRQELEKELLTLPDEITREMVLEFVIADRKKVVEPLVIIFELHSKMAKERNFSICGCDACNVIREVLQNAGISEKDG